VKACVLHAVGDLRYEEVSTPVPAGGEVLVRVGACGVCGSDIPRVFQKGTYRFPTIPGHEMAGVVTALGEGVDAAWMGRRVAVFPLIPCRRCGLCAIGEYALCTDYGYLGSRSDGGFAEYVPAPVWNLVPVPDAVSLEEAAMAEPAAVAVHALRQGRIDIGDAVAILGAGPIGVILAMWARAWGAGRVLLVDIDADKLAFAASMGFHDGCNARETDPVAWINQVTGRGADLVVEAAGSPVTFEQAMHAARPLGRVVLMGNPAGDMKLTQKGYWAILRKQLVVTGTWNSAYSDLPRNEWRLVLDALAAGQLDLKPLITHRVGLAGLYDAMVMMRDRAVFTNKILYVPQEMP